MNSDADEGFCGCLRGVCIVLQVFFSLSHTKEALFVNLISCVFYFFLFISLKIISSENTDYFSKWYKLA